MATWDGEPFDNNDKVLRPSQHRSLLVTNQLLRRGVYFLPQTPKWLNPLRRCGMLYYEDAGAFMLIKVTGR